MQVHKAMGDIIFNLLSVSLEMPAAPTAVDTSDIPQFLVWLGFGGNHWSLELLPPPQMISPQHRPSLPRVSIHTSTQSVSVYRFRPTGSYCSLCVYVVIWLMYYALIHWYTKSVITLGRVMCLSIHRVLSRLYFYTASTCSGSVQSLALGRSRCFPLFVCSFLNSKNTSL